jgi:hypothetical protein
MRSLLKCLSSICSRRTFTSHQCQLSQYYKSSFLLYRVPEIIFLIITAATTFGMVSASSVIPENQMIIPNIISELNTTYLNPEFSYPLRLDRYSCSPSTILLCLKQSVEPLDGCCFIIRDKRVTPYETVSTPFLAFLSIILPFLIFIIRALLWRHYILKEWGPSTVSMGSYCNCSWFFAIPTTTLEALRERLLDGGYDDYSALEGQHLLKDTGIRNRTQEELKGNSSKNKLSSSRNHVDDNEKYEIIDLPGAAASKFGRERGDLENDREEVRIYMSVYYFYRYVDIFV